MKNDLPSLLSKGNSERSEGTSQQIWVRINAFLSMRAPNTRDTYGGIVKEWCRFLGAEAGTLAAARKLSSATDLHAMAYKNWLENQPGEKPRAMRKESSSRAIQLGVHAPKTKKTGLEFTQSNATIAKKFAALRRIYRMLIASGLGVSENPFDTDRVPAPPKDSGRKRPTEMVNFSLVMDIVNLPDVSTQKGLRDRAILAALFGAGLRRSEAANLRIGDVRRTNNGTAFLYLRSTKAKKDAEQAIPKWAGQFIEELKNKRLKEGAGAADYLFVSYTGQGGKAATSNPVSSSGIYKLFKQYCVLGGAGQTVSPHSARATAITRLLDEGVSHREVQEFSRHASIQMVEAYDKRRLGVDRNPGKLLDYEKK